MNLWKRWLCFLFGHEYFVVQEFHPVYPGASASRRLGCRFCDGDWGMHDESRSLIPWDAEVEQMYRLTGRTVLKR